MTQTHPPASARRDLRAAWLGLKALTHRARQTALILLVSVLLSASATFTAGYVRQVEQRLVETTFADDTGNAWSLTGPPGSDLTSLLPAGAASYTEPPVTGRATGFPWRRPGESKPIDGVLAWRTDICAHLRFTAGRCPTAVGQVAVSVADAEAYGVRVGTTIVQAGTVREPISVRVSGVYEPIDADDPYWFGTPPIGRSGFDADDNRISDQLIVVRSAFDPIDHFVSADFRLDPTRLGVDDLPRVGADTAQLARAAGENQVRLLTDVPASLDRLARERAEASTNLGAAVAQLAALGLVVVLLLASVFTTSQRTEVGLARLRGVTASILRRQLTGRWTAIVLVGWVIGWPVAIGLLAVSSARLDVPFGSSAGPALAAAPVVVLLLAVVSVVPLVRGLTTQPTLDLLQTESSRTGSPRTSELVTDVALLVLAVGGLLVAVQAGSASVFGLLAPSLLAVAGGVGLSRLLTGWAVRRRGRLARSGRRPRDLLDAILTSRVRGLRLITVTTCLATTIAVFAIQVAAIGSGVREADAEVRTGAAAVIQVDGNLTPVLRSLAAFAPPGSPIEATPVVITRRADNSALRGMFVDPPSFRRVAYGADEAADPPGWDRLAVTAPAAPRFVGRSLQLEVGAHSGIGRTSPPPARTGTRAFLGAEYVTAEGERRAVTLGRIELRPEPKLRFTAAVDCATGCRLIKITVTPNGPIDGALDLSLSSAGGNGRARGTAVDLGASSSWQPDPASPDDSVDVTGRVGGLRLDVRSGGGAASVQHISAPLVLPVLTAPEVVLETRPMIAAPDGVAVPVRSVGRAAEVIPRELSGVAVADLAAVVAAGRGDVTDRMDVQVWLSAAAVSRIDDLAGVLAEHGVEVRRVDLASSAIARQQVSAPALIAALAPAMGLLGVVLAAVGVALVLTGQRTQLAGDMRALAVAGVAQATLRSACRRAMLRPGLLAVLLGTVAGAVGAALVIPGLPLLAGSAASLHPDLELRLGWVAGCGALALVAVVVTVAVSLRGVVAGPTSRAEPPT